MDGISFTRIFGDRRRRSLSSRHLLIRDDAFISDLKARISGHAARDNRARGGDWLIAFSPTRTDDLTERSLFDATLTSATQGERRLAFRVGRDWVEVGDGPMEASTRSDVGRIEEALGTAFGRVALSRPAAGGR